VVVVAFQIIFYLKIYKNNIFYIERKFETSTINKRCRADFSTQVFFFFVAQLKFNSGHRS
jgi:hypothetical protein